MVATLALPSPGDTTGAWGDLLNAWLQVSHDPDGTLKNRISVKDFGAQGDGVTDDYNAIVAADAATASGGTTLSLSHPVFLSVFVPAGWQIKVTTTGGVTIGTAAVQPIP